MTRQSGVEQPHILIPFTNRSIIPPEEASILHSRPRDFLVSKKYLFPNNKLYIVNNMTIDFEAHLSSLYPGHHYKVERLTRGLVNLTIRARRIDLTEVKDDQGESPPASLILKHTPAYIAAIGDTSPFTQDRQVIQNIPCTKTKTKTKHPTN